MQGTRYPSRPKHAIRGKGGPRPSSRACARLQEAYQPLDSVTRCIVQLVNSPAIAMMQLGRGATVRAVGLHPQNNLPVQPTPLFGRAEDVEAARQHLLAHMPVRLL